MEFSSTSETPSLAERDGFEAQPATPAERLHDFRKMLSRRWRLIALVAALTTAAALAVSLSAPNQYDATAKLLLRDEEPIDTLLDRPSSGGVTDPERETNTKVALIKLETVADRVAARLRLHMSAADLLGKVKAEVEGN